MIHSLINFGLQCHIGHELFQERTINSWNNSKNLPRKQKKKLRKKLQFDFAIINYSENNFLFI